MAQALSEEEFHRMQAQLLELRTQNYQLSDDLRKNTTELNAVRLKTVTLEKDYIKAQKALNKSKKAQEVDALLSENEMLQGKLHSQEDDFRLQNSTLMQELSKLCTQIEELQHEIKELKDGKGLQAESSGTISISVDGELLRLQAENAALQKKMTALQEHHESEIKSQRGAEVSETKASETDGLADTNGVRLHSDVSETREDSAAGTNDRLEQAEAKCAKLEQRVAELSGPAVRTPGLVMKQDALRWSALCPNPITQCFGPEVELQLHTEVEEKRLLKEQLQALESSKQADITQLQEEIAKLSDKLKKKQDRFLRSQAEKEALYNDSRTKIDEIQQRKEEELKSLNIRIQKLQGDLLSANQIQTVKTQEMNLLRDQNTALNVELQQRRTEQESFLAQRDDLNSQLQEGNRANSRLLEQLTVLDQWKDRLQQELEEAKKTADKRKAMLDELAMEIITEKSRHKEELSDVRLQHEKEVLGVRARYEKELRGLHEDKNRTEEGIRSQLRDEKARNKELEGLQQCVEELQAQVQSMEDTKGWFERRLKDAEESMEKSCLEHQESTEKLQEEHSLQLEGKASDIDGVNLQLTEVEKERDVHFETIGKLKQEIKDTVDGQRILEKKGSSALKDLKRQLQLERKRADKLQERLQEILTNTKTRTGLEELVLSEISSPSPKQQRGDSSSVSSFSYGEIMKEGATSQNINKSASGSPQSQRPADLSDDEVGELFQRLAGVQQEKWMLEEKVKHLEVSCSSMADDICKKSSIIETYVMDSRIAHGAHGATAVAHHVGQVGGHGHGLGSVLRDLVKPGDENMREMNKKLQNMLEEQLTKNMHLQKPSSLHHPSSHKLPSTPAREGKPVMQPISYVSALLLPADVAISCPSIVGVQCVIEAVHAHGHPAWEAVRECVWESPNSE
ncbi:GRIP1-associated protein 1 isoform X5 [Oncorhynchus kisutch]|uniref:GRIP1-associated protein 1 isoform X5 n=1 Tax=Oncorhynchus kisutch TaxID=8019 RepID=UPI0012DD5EF4|nr:GRIP1-associated protein 1 isoform X5 [Oncorhynchus kisutch]